MPGHMLILTVGLQEGHLSWSLASSSGAGLPVTAVPEL